MTYTHANDAVGYDQALGGRAGPRVRVVRVPPDPVHEEGSGQAQGQKQQAAKALMAVLMVPYPWLRANSTMRSAKAWQLSMGMAL